MKSIIFEKALLKDRWAENVLLQIDAAGLISNIETDYIGSGEKVTGFALPGINNIHSHAFQRAMAGLAEYSGGGADSFWTWRDIMYRFAGNISANDLKAVASQLYVEMLKGGFVSVAEFHYLHDAPDGAIDMSGALMDAAHDVGLGLCHLPVLYMASGFGAKPLTDAQQRFGLGVEKFINLLTKLNDKIPDHDNQHLGLAFHSLRAVPEEALKYVLAHNPTDGPIHIHIAEQVAEVDDCIAFSEKRPVEWLFENAQVNEQWCLIHATHLNDQEVKMIARSGAVVGLCPATEANLGDGLFPLKAFMDHGGNIGIGSDSHISVSVVEELRLLEYGQRLNEQQRNIATSEDEVHTGTNLYKHALKGGAMASGFNNGKIEIGKRADLIVLDSAAATLLGTPDKHIIDRFIFNGNQNVIKHVFVSGERVINNHKHLSEVRIYEEFKAVMERLQKYLD